MSPFKEPQPRKKAVEDDAKKVIGGQWPPYKRLGDEARWDARDEKAHADLEEARQASAQTPIMVLPDHTQFELRKAALEAASRREAKGRGFWTNVRIFEDYLREGTKPL